MPKFAYTALGLDNKKRKGQIDARDEGDAQRILRSQKLVPTQLTLLEGKTTRYRLTPSEVSEFSRQISSMLQSGITIVRALEIIKDRDFKPQVCTIYQSLHKEVQQGCTLSEAMRTLGNAFPNLLINMYIAGEASGQLERSADKMATHYDKENRLNGKVKTAMTYPMILAVVTVAVIILLFTAILPQFFLVFIDMDTELPPLTKIMMAISHFMTTKWYVPIILVTLFVFGARYLLRIEKVAHRYDKMKLSMPVAGKLLKIIYTARFSRTLSSLYSSGLSMINALEISSSIIGNLYVVRQFDALITDVRNGDPLSETIARVDGMDKKLSTTILIGEESGRLDAMLESVADSYDYEADQATSRLVQLIEPVMLIVMAFIVGVVMFSVIMPLISLYQNIG